MNRRTFLQQTTVATVGVIASPFRGAAAPPASRIVDTHTHFYDPLRQAGVPWPNKGSRLYRQVLPKDWLAVAAPHGVSEAVVVEASSWLEDNAWILDLAAAERSILGFVGHLLPHEVDFPKHLQRFAAHPIFRGIRVAHGDFLGNVDKSEFRSGLGLMVDLDLELDINGPPALLLPVAKLAAEMPSLRLVINHVGSAGDPTRLSEEWRTGMKAAGKQKNVFCKVSALNEQTDASQKEWGQAPRETAYYTPILDHCWECFGEDRLVYGSNWPVCEKGGTYADQLKVVTEYFAARGGEASEKYFWKNARNAYRWTERTTR
jgi:predicted TIM-barrel fold metal-dependent hydrolase